MKDALNGLNVDTERMMANLEISQGQIYSEAVTMALVKRLGKSEARKLIEESVRDARKQRRHLREVLSTNPKVLQYLSADDLKKLFEPEHSLGLSETLVERVLRSRSE